jgi:hypothetical protein
MISTDQHAFGAEVNPIPLVLLAEQVGSNDAAVRVRCSSCLLRPLPHLPLGLIR